MLDVLEAIDVMTAAASARVHVRRSARQRLLANCTAVPMAHTNMHMSWECAHVLLLITQTVHMAVAYQSLAHIMMSVTWGCAQTQLAGVAGAVCGIWSWCCHARVHRLLGVGLLGLRLLQMGLLG